MNNQSSINLPKWFWAVAILALLWNLMGVMAFISDIMMTPEALAKLPEDHQKLYASNPLWSKIAYGVAVFAGVLGCVGLLMRKGWAVPVFALSLLGVAIQQINIYFISNALEVLGTSAVPLMMMVLLIALFLVWFSNMSKGKGWIT